METLSTVVQDLVDVLGGQAVAVLAGAANTEAVGSWMSEGKRPDAADERRTRTAARVVEILRARLGDETIRSWFFGANHNLNDEMPLAVIAKCDADLAMSQVITAAQETVQTLS